MNKYSIVSEPLSTPRGIDKNENTFSENIIEKNSAPVKKERNIFSNALILLVLATRKAEEYIRITIKRNNNLPKIVIV